MKTLREFLLQRHRAAETKLDALRENVVATQLSSANLQSPSTPSGETVRVRGLLLNIWLELIFPCRKLWTGLAAAWVLILVANISSSDSTGKDISNVSSSGPGIVTALREQRQMLSQLLDPIASSPTLQTRRPGPRGDLRNIVKFG